MGWLPALTGVLNTGWLLLFQYEVFVLTVPVMVALLVTLIVIHQRLWSVRDELRAASRFAVRYPFSIYLGWITVATIANITSFLDFINWSGWGIAPETWTLIMLGAALLIALAMTITRRNVPYLLVLIWALSGIAI